MMKAGKYYIGDLCYVMNDEWDEVCNLTISGNEVLNGEFNLKDGRRFAMFTTRWGDGNYFDQHGKSYDVDSGSIGCILISDIDMKKERNFLSGGNVYDFDKDFEVFSKDGNITFGYVTIDTDPVEEEEFDEEDVY